MRLFFSLKLGKFIVAPGTTQELISIQQKRSPASAIEIQFLGGDNDITPQELSPGAVGRFEVKEDGKYDADAIFGALSWNKTGSGTTTFYTFLIDLMTTAGDVLLGVNEPVTVTATAATDLLTATAHGLVAGNVVQFSTTGTLPGGLSVNTDYYVIAGGLTANDFKVSLTLGGTAVDITSTGSGVHKFRLTDNDDASVNLMCAMEYVADGYTYESQTMVFEYINDVCRDADTVSTPVAQNIVLNVRAGKPAITNGAEFTDVTFSSAFSSGANVVVVCIVAKPSGSDNVFAIVRDDLVTNAGFRAEYSANIPGTGYKLHYHAIQI